MVVIDGLNARAYDHLHDDDDGDHACGRDHAYDRDHVHDDDDGHHACDRDHACDRGSDVEFHSDPQSAHACKQFRFY